MKLKGLLFYSLLAGFIILSSNAFGDDSTNDVTQSTGDDHTADQNAAIKDFKFEGIGLGATFAEVKAKYPDMEFEKDQSDPKVKLAVWANLNPKTADLADYSFFNGKLYKIGVVYDSETLGKIGGAETIHERLVSKFGKEDKNSPDQDRICDYDWQFYDAERYMNYWVNRKDNSGCLVVMDKELSRQLRKAQKAKADVGF